MQYSIEAHHDLHALVLCSWEIGSLAIYVGDDYSDVASFGADVANKWGYTLVLT